jgi:hypothetical protein
MRRNLKLHSITAPLKVRLKSLVVGGEAVPQHETFQCGYTYEIDIPFKRQETWVEK